MFVVVMKFAKKLLGKTFFWKLLKKAKRLFQFLSNRIAYSMLYEKPVRLGKNNPDTVFYLIGYFHDSNFLYQGLLSTWFAFMPEVLYGLSKGYVPVIDMLNNYKPLLLDKSLYGKKNAWDLYFHQPQSKYSLSDIFHSQKVIFARNNGPELSKNIQWARLPLSDTDFELCQKMIKYGGLVDDIVKAGELFIKKNFKSCKKVLGVSFRREFERLHYFDSPLTPKGTHDVRATLSQLIEAIRDALLELKYDFVFLMADDRESYTAVKKIFGENCFFSDRVVWHLFRDGKPVPPDKVDLITVESNKRENDVMLRGLEYMTDVYILSKCDSLLSAGGSADLFAYILNNKKYEHVIQLKNK